jgi:hypothetical protein
MIVAPPMEAVAQLVLDQSAAVYQPAPVPAIALPVPREPHAPAPAP